MDEGQEPAADKGDSAKEPSLDPESVEDLETRESDADFVKGGAMMAYRTRNKQ